MSNRFEKYAQTEEGQAFVRVIEASDNVAKYREHSLAGRPALQALASILAPMLDALASKKDQDFLRRFAGYWVGKVMRGLGFHSVREGKRIPGSVIGTGTVWAIDPQGIRVLDVRPADCANRIELKVYRGPDGQPTAEWEAVQSVEKAAPAATALAGAKDYATKWGINTIVVHDPDHLLAAA